jgi:C-terminal processing protease CtpA/Prc
VAVLTNRRCFSATEEFVLAMKVLPHVVVVGDTTGGGIGNPLYRELPNGWVYQVPRWIEFTPEMTIIEGVGLAPDFPVSISKADSDRGRDTILEEAIRLLGERVAAGRG